MKKAKEEISTTGGVAPRMEPMVGTFKFPHNDTKKEKERKKRKTMMNKGKKKRHSPYTLDEQSHKLIRDTIFEVVLKESAGDERIANIMGMFDGINKQIALSMGYSKQFVYDALKMGELKGAKKLSFRRASTELKHMQRLLDDMNALVTKVYQISEEPELEEVEEAPRMVRRPQRERR